ncbi:MAG: PqqD family protein [Candidatus Methanoplasma sp.]|jgi:hypothetical protein|nr:PqqD family protein [Candidatus Methanoplasma sp.]
MLACDLDSVGDLRFRLQKNNITNHFEKEDAAVIRTRFTGSVDTFLNKTASFMLNRILEHKELSVTEMVDLITAKYDVDDRERIIIDVIDTLNMLWKLAIIRWISTNPFAPEPVKYGNGEIIKATQDLTAEILRFMKASRNYNSPYFNDINKNQLMGGLVLDTTPTYIYVENKKILCSVTITKMHSGIIVCIGNCIDCEKISSILKQIIDKEEEIEIVLLGFTHCENTEIDFARELGFNYAGKLKKETVRGDVDMFVY